MRVVEHQDTLAREKMESSFLQTFKVRLVEALSNLILVYCSRFGLDAL